MEKTIDHGKGELIEIHDMPRSASQVAHLYLLPNGSPPNLDYIHEIEYDPVHCHYSSRSVREGVTYAWTISFMATVHVPVFDHHIRM